MNSSRNSSSANSSSANTSSAKSAEFAAGVQLRRARRIARLSQRELAAKAQVPLSTWPVNQPYAIHHTVDWWGWYRSWRGSPARGSRR